VPVDDGGRRVAVELVAHVNQLLHRGDVDVVDGAEVQDDGLECWPVGVVFRDLAVAGARVVPRPVAGPGVVVEVGAARFREDVVG